VLVLLVLEEVENAIFFHQARDKMKIRFPVLDAVVPGLKATLKRILDITKTEVFANLEDNVGHGHILEDATIGGAREKPEPGDDLSSIMCKPHIIARLGKTADTAVDVALTAICQEDAEGNPLTHNPVKGNGSVYREQIKMKLEQLRYSFLSCKSSEKQRVLTEGGIDGNEPVFLYVRHEINALFLLPERRTQSFVSVCLSLL
jgi:hypothetical protein